MSTATILSWLLSVKLCVDQVRSYCQLTDMKTFETISTRRLNNSNVSYLFVVIVICEL